MSALTSSQLQVVQHQQGHARVVAVAGAGKTTTLTHFIQQRLQDGCSPRRMLVLMYNKSAQQDFERKLQRLIEGQPLPEVRTFHSLGLRIYRKLIELGELPAFQQSLLSDSEMDSVVWRLLQQLADDDTRQDILSQRKKWVEPACSFIDLVKAGLKPAAEVFDQLDLPPECRLFVEAFDLFEQWRKDNRRIGFSDMIYDPVRLLAERQDLAGYFGGHMQWILVDEYQDINEIQQTLLDILHGGRGSVMVIGDPDQTIYEFRGSMPEFIVSGFDKRLGDVTVYQLPETFRYGPQLSLAANYLIHHNREREPVVGRSHTSTPATSVQAHECSPASEARTTLQLVQQALEQHQPSDIAVISRLWGLSAPIELALLRANVPYRLDHSQSVLERWELEIFWLLLEIAAGRFQQRTVEQRRDAWLTILTTPYPKIRRNLLESMATQLANASQHYGAAMQAAIPDDLNKWQKSQLKERAEVLDSAELIRMPARRLLNTWIDVTELEQGVKDSAFSAQQVEDRLQTIRAFVQFMGESEHNTDTAYDYLVEMRDRARQQNSSKQQGVRLTSIHKSKGLEWPVVIVPGLNGHYFPYQPEGAFTTPASVESERRLLYVAITRARHQVHLIRPTPARGKQIPDRELDSPFWRELSLTDSQRLDKALAAGESEVTLLAKPPEWLEGLLSQCEPVLKVDVKAEKPAAADGRYARPRRVSAPPQTLRAQRVKHASLGSGRVLDKDEKYIKILFDGEQEPRLLVLEVARDHLQWL